MERRHLPFQLPSNYEAPGLRKTKLMAPISPFRHAGQSGLYMSEWLSELATIADELCVLRAVHVDAGAHAPAVRQMHTVQVRPAMGSWVLYGLGTENQNIPVGSPGPADPPVIRITARPDADSSSQRRQLHFLQALNEDHLTRQGHDANMRGMMQAYELAFRMPVEAPGLMDLASESKATLDAYGVNELDTRDIGVLCLLARRLLETGVRFVQVNDGGWDHHASIRWVSPRNAALLTSLSPPSFAISNNAASSTIRSLSGVANSAAPPFDQYLSLGVDGKIHLHDLRATILHLLGLDHERLTHRHAGRDFRLTDVYGRVVREILV